MRTASGATLDFGRLALLLLLMGASWYFWYSPVLWPVKVLVVMMHESGHAIASLLVGGSVDRVHLQVNEGGSCLSRLPPGVLNRVIVSSAGYLGSAVAGAGLMLATFRFRLGRAVMGAASVWLAVMGFFYAGDPFTLAFCLGMALAMGLGARFLPTGLVDALNLFLAAFTALYVIFDLRDDLWNSAVRAQSDAAILASETWVPSIVWAALWTLLSLGLLGVSAYWAMHAKPGGGVKMPPMARTRRV
ncbi:M50 family metallopeptidase [Corallococcus exiguus]|uniref:M50 family metallopeptidase n=1 Tax=Corallococcus TaxID=83461 RepID=UPI000EC22E26|nr:MULTISPECIES: M50 family metallopeptidase [Corallococcus]NNB87912.1 M50 family metallopeptidase [Corallococcus exiguus]NNB94985.1 M50 family metallopeptidase [Corallococcus exiguus]NNC05307.1 M50 family metallopeptidase [Corallococcus exiguus]NPC48094.1 M50 family metallopeptidase [Corallococcus exiguus]RKH76933.1 M50 family peptidase [Corallococcus sp. AB032C]